MVSCAGKQRAASINQSDDAGLKPGATFVTFGWKKPQGFAESALRYIFANCATWLRNILARSQERSFRKMSLTT